LSDFLFHPAAAAELDVIVRYTRHQRGKAQAQARTCSGKMKRCALPLRQLPDTSGRAGGWLQGLSLVRCEQHGIAFL
jgi:plasmid stabilization system protein ParE